MEGFKSLFKATSKTDMGDDGATVMPQDVRAESIITKVECPSVTLLVGVPKAAKF